MKQKLIIIGLLVVALGVGGYFVLNGAINIGDRKTDPISIETGQLDSSQQEAEIMLLSPFPDGYSARIEAQVEDINIPSNKITNDTSVQYSLSHNKTIKILVLNSSPLADLPEIADIKNKEIYVVTPGTPKLKPGDIVMADLSSCKMEARNTRGIAYHVLFCFENLLYINKIKFVLKTIPNSNIKQPPLHGSLLVGATDKESYGSNELVKYSIESLSDYFLWYLPYQDSIALKYSKILKKNGNDWVDLPSGELSPAESGVAPVPLIKIKSHGKYSDAISLSRIAESGTYKIAMFYTFSSDDFHSFNQEPLVAYTNEFYVNKDSYTQTACLKKSQTATTSSQNPVPYVISVIDKESGETISAFAIENVSSGKDYMTETHKCGVYIIRALSSGESPEGNLEVWKYSYDGISRKISDSSSSSFTIDPQERYISYTRGYRYSGDYELVITDFVNKKDVFVLTGEEAEEIDPEFDVDFSFKGGWTKDGRYLLGQTLYEYGPGDADVISYFRIDSTTWEIDFRKVEDRPFLDK